MKKGINAWAKELKHNEGFAKKYEGVKTVEDILNIAKTQGYDISKKDLEELDLDAVAGGLAGVDVKANLNLKIDKTVKEATMTTIAQGDHSEAYTTGNINIK